MKILIINFSGRNFGNCESIASFIKENLKGEIQIRSFANMDIHPCGLCQ